MVRERVRDVLEKLGNILKDTHHSFVAITPLAEGADRIVADEILNFKPSKPLDDPGLEVITQDNVSEISHSISPQLQDFLDKASTIVSLKDVLAEKAYQERIDFYTLAGQLVADDCDVLIAMWDGKRGDTAHILDYARNNIGRSIFLINPINGQLKIEQNGDQILKNLKYHNIYNTENKSCSDIIKAQNKEYPYIHEKVQALKLIDQQKRLIDTNIFPQFVKSDLLAINYQTWHLLSINMVYWAAGAAVFIVAFQVIFLTFGSWIFYVEAGLMLSILLLIGLNRKLDWHRKWVDYRYLAERLRAALIFSVGNLECMVSENLPHLRAHDDWTSSAYQHVYQKQMSLDCPELPLEDLKKFILEHWVQDQIGFYHKRSLEHQKIDERYLKLIYFFFGATIVLALLHTLPFIEEVSLSNVLLIIGTNVALLQNMHVSQLISFLVIIFPALAASVAGIRIQHEFSKTSTRYAHMESYLKKVAYEIENVKDREKLEQIIQKANKMTLREHQSWKATISERDIEPGF